MLIFLKARGSRLSIGAALLFLTLSPLAARAGDIFSTEKLASPSPDVAAESHATRFVCGEGLAENQVLTLEDVVERALCDNPQTRIAWINARIQAAQVGVSKSTYLPSLTINGSAAQTSVNSQTSTVGGSGSYESQDVNATLTYLVYDFGQRSSNLENAVQTLRSLNATHDAVIQTVFLSAVQGYYQLSAADALVDSSKETEKSALESYNAASAKFKLGAATPADRLQAKTAHSQAVLTRIQAEGAARNAKGTLANVMGLEPTLKFSIFPPADVRPDEKMEEDIGKLIESGRAQRPDLVAAQAQTKAAQANIEAAKAAGMATLSLSGSMDRSSGGSTNSTLDTGSVGLQLTIPIFTGYGTTYRVRTAEEQAQLRLAQEEQIRRLVALDVWQAYQNLVTSAQSVRSSEDLVASATESHKVVLARYKAGQGNILDVLTAQSALESAKQQRIQAVNNWRINKATLAKAMGGLESTSGLEGAATNDRQNRKME